MRQSRLLFSLLAGTSIFLAYPKFGFWPVIFLAPIFLNALVLHCKDFWSGFRYGFLTSVFVMVGGFYWVTHAIHEFGNFSWPISIFLFLGFCGFGALNFPLFCACAVTLHHWIKLEKQSNRWMHLWYALGIPSLFTFIEFVIPKLFPWSFGHALYKALPLIQIAEFTGETFLSFLIYSLGSTLSFYLFLKLPWLEEADSQANPPKGTQLIIPKYIYFLIPVTLLIVCLGVGFFKLRNQNQPVPNRRALRVQLVQANIGSIIKVEARHGILEKMRMIMSKYQDLTEAQLQSSQSRPELILWPETAMPFFVVGEGRFAKELYQKVRDWNIPLITGGYLPNALAPTRDFNGAVLLDPDPETKDIVSQKYLKNILLAFGEIMPFGDWFPILYKWFPEVSHFGAGTTQEIFTLRNGIRLGMTICYEAIRPEYVRQIGKKNIHALINLTNDSWFGDTSEPFQHAALSIFRAIELRVPLVRVTNTGMSLVADEWGNYGEENPGGHPLYPGEEGSLQTEIWINENASRTFYVRFGDWFTGVCFLNLALFLLLRRKDAPLSA